MAGLDPGGDVQFKPGACTVAEIKRYPSGDCSEYTHRILQPGQIEEWAEETGEFASDTKFSGRVRWIFACAAPTSVEMEGSYISASETLELAMSRETFSWLAQRYQFSGCLDTWRYRATSGSASRKIEYDDTGGIKSVAFTISIRLSGSFASIISVHHCFRDNTTTTLALRVSPYEQRLIQQTLEQHHDLIGHALLVLTMLADISLASNMFFMQKIRHELSVIEKATGQHAWLQIPAVDAPAHDSELSRLGHAAKIHISLSYRRIESVQCFLELVKESGAELEKDADEPFTRTKSGPGDAYGQWVGDLEQQLKFRMVDLKYNERRADNQITAIYGLLTQRDNMVGVSVAIESKKISEESKKISEASNRDGSALKSLTVLAAVFLPATSVATLFSLKTFDNTPIWVYWVVVIPLTLVIIGPWFWWTVVYRQRQIIAQELPGPDTTNQGILLDIEHAFSSPQSSPGPGSTPGLLSTMRQIRSHTRSLHYSQSQSGAPELVKTEQVFGKKE
ncbi:hypothetical protein BJY01DRAFT_246736 [Aspergillus pseudoustus]|uniref:Mg2+ transporter protein, CorA-like/Zinc transport protein ZntB n=1 Tax=Aspergillus pseudoustus TaxID=1810923 RepID=A0ABR4K5C8_9EURO